MTKNIVLKIGGSIIYTSDLEINWDNLQKIKNWYKKAKVNYEKIVLVVGGGNLSREMQNKMSKNIMQEEYLHNIAMSVTQTNAAMLQAFLEDDTSFIPHRLGDAYEFLNEDGCKTLISGGLKVGWSTDMDAAAYADMLDLDIVHKLSDVDYVYDFDPDSVAQAKSFVDLSWEQYFNIFDIKEGERHKANSNIPIDVMCAQFCKGKGISFFVCGGKTLLNNDDIDTVIKVGTLIH